MFLKPKLIRTPSYLHRNIHFPSYLREQLMSWSDSHQHWWQPKGLQRVKGQYNPGCEGFLNRDNKADSTGPEVKASFFCFCFFLWVSLLFVCQFVSYQATPETITEIFQFKVVGYNVHVIDHSRGWFKEKTSPSVFDGI